MSMVEFALAFRSSAQPRVVWYDEACSQPRGEDRHPPAHSCHAPPRAGRVGPQVADDEGADGHGDELREVRGEWNKHHACSRRRNGYGIQLWSFGGRAM